MIAVVLALTTGACTIHKHYHHQAPPAERYAQAPEAQTHHDGDYDERRYHEHHRDLDRGDRPIAPPYARPDAATRSYSYSEHRCDCQHREHRRRPAPRRRSPGYPIRPGPVVPDNPVEWLE